MLAIRPPEYFPSIQYCALMLAAEEFVLADTFQYSRQSFQNRAKIRTPQGWQWISVPLQGKQHGTPIQHVLLDQQMTDWQRQQWKTIATNYRSSAFFIYFEDLFDQFFRQPYTHRAHQIITGAARAERHDDADGFCRIGCRIGLSNNDGGCYRERCGTQWGRQG